jgi:transcriptional regulator with XRE-family HTH domain
MYKRKVSRPPAAKISYAALLGQVLKKRREDLRVNQTDLAAALNISQPAYSRIEQGGTSITVSQLRIIARRLHIEPNSLLSQVDQWTQLLNMQGVEVTDEKHVPEAALLIALGILAALWAASK